MVAEHKPEIDAMERGFRAGREATKTEAEAYHAEVVRLKRGIEFVRDTLTGSDCALCQSALEFLEGLLKGRKGVSNAAD
jgi:hypothetical protein